MEVIINRNDIEELIKSYKNVNETFYFVSYACVNTNMWRCKFFLEGKECKLNVFFKVKSINLVPTGKNSELTLKVVEYIRSKGFDSKTNSKTISVKISRTQVNQLLKYIEDECGNMIIYEINNNIIKFKGYNEDTLVMHYYDETSTAVFQGKPFFVFSIIINYIAIVADLSVADIIELNNRFSDMNTPISLVREEMKSKLGKSHYFLDEPLLKFISGSFSLLRTNINCEDYTGYIAGTFKALEGYMKKVLINKYNCTLAPKAQFSMLGKGPDGKCDLSRNNSLSATEELYWDKLYALYMDKRNVYLHATVDPAANKVLESKQEAIELTDEIIKTINESYEIFYKR